MDAAVLKVRVAERVDARADALDRLALEIHARPELAYEERFAADALASYLSREGADVRRSAGGLETAFVAEAGSGALIRAGVFADVDAALMYHPGDRDELDPLMLAMVTLDVELRGKAAHAAAEPHEGINALDGLILGWNALSALRLVVRSDSRV